MPDLKQILAGTVKEIAQALDPLTFDELTELKALEEAGEKRKGVLSAIDAALVAAAEAMAPAGDDAIEPILAEASSIDLSHPAVAADLRAGTTELQNRIDFNDPYAGGREIVEASLASTSED